jgi:hypothetical protein
MLVGSLAGDRLLLRDLGPYVIIFIECVCVCVCVLLQPLPLYDDHVMLRYLGLYGIIL